MAWGDKTNNRKRISSETKTLPKNPYSPGGVESLRISLYRLLRSRTAVFRTLGRFASRFESELGKQALEVNADAVRIVLEASEPVVKGVRFGNQKKKIFLEEYEILWSFVQEIGIREMILDPRLRQTQIEDIFNLLYFHRYELSKDPDHPDTAAAVRGLRSREGLHTAGVLIRLQDSVLTAGYAYCSLRYSRLVRWFEGRQRRRLRNHRALFHAAPWCGLLLAAGVLGPSFVYAVRYEYGFLAGLISAAGIILFALITLLVMTIGSVEYDNEENAYQFRRAQAQLRKYSSRVQTDIQKAKEIQERLLPVFDSLPFRNQISWFGRTMPAAEAGGDYFDIQRTDQEKLAFLFCDVSGHGMAAAFITAVIKTSFQACLDRKFSLRAMTGYLNTSLWRLTPADSFAAAFAGIYNPSTHILMYCSAGLVPEPWRIPADPAEPIQTLRDARNLPLGVDSKTTYKTARCTLKAGDKLVLVSDGIIKSEDSDGHEYGPEPLESLLARHRTEPIREMVERIFHSVQEFAGTAGQMDDRTVLAAEIFS